MFRTSHIRTKLTVALAVPLVALIAIAGLEVLDARSQVGDAKSQAALAESSIGPGSTVVHLQNERDRAYIDLIGLSAQARLTVASNAAARQLTDKASTAFRGDTAARGRVVSAAFEPAWTAMAGLPQLRADIDARPANATDETFADDVFQRYTDIIGAFFDGTSKVALTVDDASLRNGAALVDASTRVGEIQTQIVRSLLQAKTAQRLDDSLVRQDVAALFDRARQVDATIRTSATGSYAGIADATLAEPVVTDFNRQIAAYLAGDTIEVSGLLASLTSDPTIGYSGLRTKAAGILSGEATRMQSDALTRQAVLGGIALAGLLLTLLVSWLASRSITRPLRSLKEQAEEMASTRLPAAVRTILDTPAGEDVVIPEVPPIRVSSRDEVAEVAAALSAVQSNAVDLAVEQAVLRRNISDSYINLGRRNQNLLIRQLDFITDLERNETDPDALEGLFRLDHLATRMRRNAESLLVLAGVEPPRQWAAPVRAVDVVRSALGEVEDYQRVVVAHLEPASVTGAVAAEISHVLAELVENALSFSPPDQSVEVKGRLTTAGYAFTIADNGFGMPADDIRLANRRLAGQESFTVAPSRYLGHYVAGHLASRLGITVELEAGPSGGVTASVTVPMGLVVDDELERALAKAKGPDAAGAAPITAGPSAAAVAPERTASGLPRRGERPQPQPVEAAPLAETEPVREPVRAMQPEPSMPESVVAGAPLAPVAPLIPPVRDPGDFVGLPMSQGPSLFSATAGIARNGRGVAKSNGHANGNGNGHANGNGNGHAAPVGDAAGLVRRVPGAQRPDAPITTRIADAEPSPPERTTPDDVYAFLSSFQSGVARGQADAVGDAFVEHQEDGR